MALNDDNDRVAKIIKDLEQRISNLEEKSRSDTQPNILLTQVDTAGADDRIDGVTTHTLDTGTWGNEGWSTAAWGSLE